MYTADLSGDRVWAHGLRERDVMQEVGKVDMPVKGMHPRHLVAHPAGGYLHVVMEAGNEVVEYALDDRGLPTGGGGGRWSLIPEGMFLFSEILHMSASDRHLQAHKIPPTGPLKLHTRLHTVICGPRPARRQTRRCTAIYLVSP